MTDDARVKTGVAFDPENLTWLKSHGNVSQKINELIAAHRTGKVVETGEVLQGEDGKGCIQPLDPAYKPENCPFRIAYPQLQQAKNGLVLQESFCTKCPNYKKDFEAFKIQLRIEAREKQRTLDGVRPSAPAMITTRTTALLEFTIKCTECDKDWDSLYFEDRANPLHDMHHAIASHLNIAHGIAAVPPEMSPFRRQEALKQEMQSP